MAEYVVLIVGDADRWWTTMDPEQRAAGYAEYNRFGEELTRRGHRITGGAELHATLTCDDGHPVGDRRDVLPALGPGATRREPWPRGRLRAPPQVGS